MGLLLCFVGVVLCVVGVIWGAVDHWPFLITAHGAALLLLGVDVVNANVETEQAENAASFAAPAVDNCACSADWGDLCFSGDEAKVCVRKSSGGT